MPVHNFQAEGLRSSAGIRRSWLATRRSPRYGWSIGTPQLPSHLADDGKVDNRWASAIISALVARY